MTGRIRRTPEDTSRDPKLYPTTAVEPPPHDPPHDFKPGCTPCAQWRIASRRGLTVAQLLDVTPQPYGDAPTNWGDTRAAVIDGEPIPEPVFLTVTPTTEADHEQRLANLRKWIADGKPLNVVDEFLRPNRAVRRAVSRRH